MALSTAAAGFAKRVDEYVAGRPDYPPEVLAALPSAETIVELGAGTGKFTRVLIGRAKRVVAVEPLPEMAARIPQGGDTGIEVINAKAEAVPLPDGTADLVCCATSYHWFDYPEAANEIHRLLKPGGHLALLWNRRDSNVPWVGEFSKLIEGYSKDSRRFGSDYWRQIFTNPNFERVGDYAFPFVHRMPVSGIVDRAFSTSYIAQLPEAEAADLRAKLAALIERHDTLRSATEVEFPYIALLYLLKRVP
ncbi:MAG TPA: methyltransferase domain-containing protein [Magnetospirillaceae bacterium]|jgi:SAM-dependent methyltransferase